MKRRFGHALALRAVLCAGVVALAGCDFAPRYATPKIAAPEKFKDSAPSGLRAPLTEDWWANFHDRELDRLEALIETDNPDYAAALARYEQAKAFLDLANSAFFPTILGPPDLSYNKQSENRPLRSKNQPTYYGANQLYGQLTWELDIWGRIRDVVASSKAGAQANDDLLAATSCRFTPAWRGPISPCAAPTPRPPCWRAPSNSTNRR